MRKRPLPILLPVILLAHPAFAQDAGTPPTAPPADSADAGQDSGQSALELHVDKSKVDLKGHKLEVTANRELSRIPTSDETVARIELIAHDTQGYWAAVAMIPWSVSVPHEDVTFRSGSADIQDTEKEKLEASYTRIAEILAAHQDLGTITLFIAGHTDTVGSNEANLRLSLRRAEAIAGWFRKRGLTLPIAYEGFGESSLLVETRDNVSEARNRRVDYILALDIPNIPAKGFTPSWKRMS